VNLITVINVVRREDQADILKELGAQHIVVTSEGYNSRQIDSINTPCMPPSIFTREK
jgi:NADPH:quinone reductase-like Zn-dependent oxidoreductase